MESTTYDIEEARAHLALLVERAAAGAEVIITEAGRPVARLVPLAARPARAPGGWGALRASDDFDAPLPDDVLDAFEGR